MIKLNTNQILVTPQGSSSSPVGAVEKTNSKDLGSEINTASSMFKGSAQYINIGMDLGEYSMAVDPKQEQIKEDLFSVVSQYIPKGGHSSEYWHFRILGISGSIEVLSGELHKNIEPIKMTKEDYEFEEFVKENRERYQNREITREEFNRLVLEYEAQLIERSRKEETPSSGQKPINLEELFRDKTMEDPHYRVKTIFGEITLEDKRENERKNFQHLYNLSDDFAKTERFEELFKEFSIKREKFLYSGNALSLHNNDTHEELKSEFSSNVLSKIDNIKYFEEVRDRLTDLLHSNRIDDVKGDNFKQRVTEKVEKSIQLYDNIAKDLRKLWKYGDFDTFS
ncbi:MAG: hypothetical protein OIF32_12505 [Campylobacterales bacterium]|nr:hypothetical protein [Campylobacterales bacterium]